MTHVRTTLTLLLVLCLTATVGLAQDKLIPRKILENERPRKTRAANVEKARVKVMAGYSKLMEQAAKLQPEVDKYNARIDSATARHLKGAAEAAKQSHKMFTFLDRKAIEAKAAATHRMAFNEILYQQLQGTVAQFGACFPDIDQIGPFSIRPGGCLTFWGTCFGPPQGKVLLEIRQNEVVELEVISWTETEVVAQLNPIIGEVPLRQYYGKVWLQSGGGATSNEWPMMYYPIQSEYIASWTNHIWGGLFGNHEDGVFLENMNLGDGDFTIWRAEHSHWGDGWSEMRSPTAGGQSLGQGYHMGVDAGGHAYMSLLYVVFGPKGIYPPEVPDLGPWGYLGDISW